MKSLPLTSEQFNALMQLVYLGNFVANATRDNDAIIQPFEDIEQYIYANAEDFGGGECVDRHDAVEGVYPTREFEEMMDPFIDKYDQDIFWEELIHRLAERDLIDKFGETAVAGMGIVERIENEREFTKKIYRCFFRSGDPQSCT